jgi:hypothetical protein
LWSAVSEFFASKISVLNFIDEVIVLIFLLHLLIDSIANAHNKNKKISLTTFPLLICGLIIWTTGSLFVNGSTFTQYFKFLLSISKGFIVFYWIKNFVTEERILTELVTIIKWLILIQVPFFIIGLLVQRTGYFGDNAVGAFITGDASAVGTFFWLGIIICLGKYDTIRKRKYLYYALILALLLIITSTKQLTILLPVVLAYLYIRRIKITNFKFAIFSITGIFAAVMLYNTVEKSWMAKNYGVDASETNLLDYVDESEKLLGYYSLLYELPDEIKHPVMWGAGPGMYGSYVAMNARAPLSQKYIMSYFDLIPDGMGGSLAYRSSSIIGFWGDIGLIGLIHIFLIYLYQIFHCGKRLKAINQFVAYNLLTATGFLLIAQSFILNVFEGNSFTLNLFWILCGISAANILRKNEKSLSQ